MGVEIERKFLVVGTGWRTARPAHVRQGYLGRDARCTVRVRVVAERATLTIKGPTVGATRSEFEYPIPVDEAVELLGLRDGAIVEKRRHAVELDGLVWEVDEFLGENAGLVVAEVELESEGQAVVPPPWVGQEVTDDPRYANAALAGAPYRTWRA